MTGLVACMSDLDALYQEIILDHNRRPRNYGVLAGADPSAGPMLDLGAGTGLSTVALADAVPDATILAVEPSPALRAAVLPALLLLGGHRRRSLPATAPRAGAGRFRGR